MNSLFIRSVPSEVTSPKFARAFLQGVRATGDKNLIARIVTDDIDRDGMWAGFGSPKVWRSLMKAQADERTWYYGDHAYFGRKIWFRITRNGFQHPGVGAPDFKRLRMFHQQAEPFRRTGRQILICLQSENYHERMGSTQKQFLIDVTRRIRAVSDRQIVVRTKQTATPFEKHLRTAWCVVTHSSVCAMHALMAGVPAFATAPTAWGLLAPNDLSRIEEPYYPDADLRWALAGRLAANQWTLDEITTGQAWRKLNETV